MITRDKALNFLKKNYLGILIFIIALIFIRYFLYKQEAAFNDEKLTQFNEFTTEESSSVKTSIQRKRDNLNMLKSFFTASNSVNSRELRVFASSLIKNPDMHQVCWRSLDAKFMMNAKSEKPDNLCDTVDLLESSQLVKLKNGQDLVVLSDYTESDEGVQKGIVSIFFYLKSFKEVGKLKTSSFDHQLLITDLMSHKVSRYNLRTGTVEIKKESISREDILKTKILNLTTIGNFKFVYFSRLYRSNYIVDNRAIAICCLILLLATIFSIHLRTVLYQKEKIEEVVAQKTRDLVRSNEELNDFAHIASHDLREPLRGMRNFANFLIEDYSDKIDLQGKEYLLTIKKLSGRLEKYLDSLLIYSRLGRDELRSDLVDTRELILEAGEIFTPPSKEFKVLITVSPDKGIPAIFCDKVKILEVFGNLFQNAIRYNLNASREIKVTYSNSGDGFHVFYVTDNGIGMKKTHWERIFTIFKRLHSKEQYEGGTGLGLSLVRKTVERHEGKVWVKDSVVGKGSTIAFTLKEKTHDS